MTTRHHSTAERAFLLQLRICGWRQGTLVVNAPAPSVWNSLPSFVINSGSLTTFKSRSKTYFFRLSFDCIVHVWPHHIPASASKVTTLWRYINQFIIIIIIINVLGLRNAVSLRSTLRYYNHCLGLIPGLRVRDFPPTKALSTTLPTFAHRTAVVPTL